MQTTIHNLPDHVRIDPKAIEGELKSLLARHEQELQTIAEGAAQGDASWDSVVMPLESLSVELNDFWAPISHLNSVKSDDLLRQTHDACIQLITTYQTNYHQSVPLYRAIKAVQASDQFDSYDETKKKIVNDAVRGFERRGVDLPEDKKSRVKQLNEDLTRLNSQFQNNLLDSTESWFEHIADSSELEGLPTGTVSVAKETAAQKDLDGYVLTLDMACYSSVMRHASNRELRESMYRAYVARSSEHAKGESVDKFDNQDVVRQILTCRSELAQLLGFKNFAEYSIDEKMATSAEEVRDFLYDLLDKVLPQAQVEIQNVKEFVQQELGYENFEPWDLTYATECLRQAKYSVTDAALRPYFPIDVTIKGMFAVAESLFDISIERKTPPASWHEDVRYYEILRNSEVIARFYLDAFARGKKRGGAWMADCRSRRIVDNEVSLPVAYLTCNFTPPTDTDPAVLSHSEVVTLFHEFGHGLHHMLTQQKYASVSGINGVEWDAIELPSQFMENWCWQNDQLKRCSQHIETSESLPDEMLNQLISAKNLNSAMAIVRQLEFGLLDIELHLKTDNFDPIVLMHSIRDKTGMLACKPYDRFPMSFAHIFAGGYAAGYYSYLWAEVLSADAFAAFEEAGLDNTQTSHRFRQEIIEVGSSRKASEMYQNFRGRRASPDALLRHSGITLSG